MGLRRKAGLSGVAGGGGAQAPSPALATKTGRSSRLHIGQVMVQSPVAQSGLCVGDILVVVAGKAIGAALQCAMVEDAFWRRLEITVWRVGALVDVTAVLRGLTDA